MPNIKLHFQNYCLIVFIVLLAFKASSDSINSSTSNSIDSEKIADSTKNTTSESEKLNAHQKIDSSLFPEQLLQISDTPAFAKYVFVVDKSLRKLFLYQRSGTGIKLVEDFPADIGKNDGNKTKENDKKTPEGIYFFQNILRPPEIPFELYGKMAFTLDYPNIFDIKENKTGKGIWLHSIPETVALTRGSRGCVVVRNEVVEKLKDFIQLKETPILIFDKINFVKESDHTSRRHEITKFIDTWKSSWESKNIEDYIKFYDDGFKFGTFNKKSWHRYKKSLTSKYKFIKVSFDQPFILIHNNQLIIKTLQKYESDLHTDFGIKTIHALKDNISKDNTGYKIISEQWTAADPKGFELLSNSNENKSTAESNEKKL